MDKLTTFYFLIFTHYLAEFVLQGPAGTKKRWLNKYMLYHGGVTVIAFLVPLFNYPLAKALAGGVIIFLTHIIIDILKVELSKLFKLSPEKYFYWVLLGIDQILHLTAIFLVLTYIL